MNIFIKNFNELDAQKQEIILEMFKSEKSYYSQDNVLFEIGQSDDGFVVFIYDFKNKVLEIVEIKKWTNINLDWLRDVIKNIDNFPRWNDKVRGHIEELQKDYRGFLKKVADDIIRVYREKRFRLRDAMDYSIISSFVIASWVKEIFKTVSYLIISGEMGSGKTTILKSIAFLTYKSLISTNISLPTIVRLTDKHSTTIFIDEFGMSILERDREFFRVLRAGISGKDVYARTIGNKIEFYNVFGFKFFALSFDKNLPLDIEDRSLRIGTFRESFTVQDISEERNDLLNRLSAFRIFVLLNYEKFYDIVNKVEYYLKQIDSRLGDNLKYLFLFSNLSKEQLIELAERIYKEKKQQLTETETFEVLKILRDFIEIKMRQAIPDGLQGLITYFEKFKELRFYQADFTKFYLAVKADIGERDVVYKYPVNVLIETSKKLRNIFQNKLGFEVLTKIGSMHYYVTILKPRDLETLKHLIRVYTEERNVKRVVENVIKVLENYGQ